MNWETLRGIASLAVVVAFAYWISRDEERKEVFNPKNFPHLIKEKIDGARGMDAVDWMRFFAVGLVFTLLALLIVPNVAGVLNRGTGVRVTNEDHPVNKVSSGTRPVTGFVLLSVVFATVPVFEEWIFRRNILEWIKSKGFRHSTLVALIVSSFVFGAFHLLNSGTYIYAILPPFAGGLLFGTAYIMEGLKASCFVHVLYNELVLLIMYLPVFL